VIAEITLDKAGRVVLPKAMRDALRVGPGDALRIESEEERLILSPVRERAGLQKERGVWVFRSGRPTNTSIPSLIEQQRGRRTDDLIRDRR
jgi:AbrB family looped-hinge helix DNA binding protein